jgi:hypothetical protein
MPINVRPRMFDHKDLFRTSGQLLSSSAQDQSTALDFQVSQQLVHHEARVPLI